MMTFNINGKSFDNVEEMSREMFNEAATNPECDTLVWAYQDYVGCAFVGGRVIYPDGSYGGSYGKGKCAYRGKIYEGAIEYKGNKLYVGGEFVKDMN